MALLGNSITVRVQQHSSGVTNEIIAESTSVDAQFNAEALESTSQTNGVNAAFEGGKNTIQVSGDYLLATDAEQFDLLFVHANAGNKIEVAIYRSGVVVQSGEGVFTSLNAAGALSDSLATGAYSIEMDADVTAYGPELHTLSNAAADPNGTEADATTGFSQVNLATFESQSGIVNTGTYAIHGENDGTGPGRFYIDLQAAPFSCSNDNVYRTTFDARIANLTGEFGIGLGPNTNDTTNLIKTFTSAETSFVEYSLEWTHDANHRYFVVKKALGATDNGDIYFDNWSVKERL